MEQIEFLELLTEVIELHQDIRMYNTQYTGFNYELIVNDHLILIIQFPNFENKIVIDSTNPIPDNVDDMLQDARDYMKEKKGRVLSLKT